MDISLPHPHTINDSLRRECKHDMYVYWLISPNISTHIFKPNRCVETWKSQTCKNLRFWDQCLGTGTVFLYALRYTSNFGSAAVASQTWNWKKKEMKIDDLYLMDFYQKKWNCWLRVHLIGNKSAPLQRQVCCISVWVLQSSSCAPASSSYWTPLLPSSCLPPAHRLRRRHHLSPSLWHQWHPHLSYHPVSEHTLEHHT